MKNYTYRGLNAAQKFNIEVLWFNWNKEKYHRFHRLVDYHCIAGFGAYSIVNEEFKKRKK